MITVGIDPGLRGAIVALDDEGNIHSSGQMPVDASGKRKVIDAGRLAAILCAYAKYEDGAQFVVERASTRPGQSAQSSLTIGVGFGLIVGVLAAIKAKHIIVTPQAWMRRETGGEPGDPKQRSLRVAERRWPELPCRGPRGGKLDGIADAALIAAYGRWLLG